MTATTATTATISRWRVKVDPGDRVRLAGHAQGRGGLPVALLHGLGGTRRGWDAVASRLAATRRVLWWDHRGHGDSDAPAVRYGITRLVDDTGIVLQTVAGGPVVLVGHGLGAAVALTVAATYPHLVAAVGCVHGGLHHPRPSPAPDPANHQPGGPSGEDGRAAHGGARPDRDRDGHLVRSMSKLAWTRLLPAVEVPVLAITTPDDGSDSRLRQSMRRARGVLGDRLLEVPMPGVERMPPSQPQALADALDALAWMCANHGRVRR